jgi:hypothetical protein
MKDQNTKIQNEKINKEIIVDRKSALSQINSALKYIQKGVFLF